MAIHMFGLKKKEYERRVFKFENFIAEDKNRVRRAQRKFMRKNFKKPKSSKVFPQLKILKLPPPLICPLI